MGCFNMTCAVTNTPICYQDEVVVFPLVKEENSYNEIVFGREYFISDHPYFGKYDDYGRVEHDKGVFPEDRDDNIMFVHRYAYDTLVDMQNKSRAYYAWAIPSIGEREAKEKQDAIEAITYIQGNKGNDDKQTRAMVCMKEMLVREACRIGDSLDSRAHWIDKIMSSADPVNEFLRFKDEIVAVSYGLEKLNVRIYPSLYAGQTVETDALQDLAMRNLSKLLERDRYYDAEPDDDMRNVAVKLRKMADDIDDYVKLWESYD